MSQPEPVSQPEFVFAHGAGAPSSSEWMRRWTERLRSIGNVEVFDYPYMQAGRKTPDALPKLIDAHRAVLEKVRARASGPIVLVGKSMGGRVGCHLALEAPVAGLVCLGYPLKAAGKLAKLRDEVLLALKTPVLFVQGTRDPLCPLEVLEAVRRKMQTRSELYVIESGDHSLLATKTHLKALGHSQTDVDGGIAGVIERFVQGLG